MNKYTPGPWRVAEEKEWFNVYDTATGGRICSVDKSDEEYAKGDAGIIAAAPAMYEMLLETKALLEPLKDNPASEVFMNKLTSALTQANQ